MHSFKPAFLLCHSEASRVHGLVGGAIEKKHVGNIQVHYARLVLFCFVLFWCCISWYALYAMVYWLVLQRLSYHYALGDGTRALAFKYAKAAADRCCELQEYPTAFVYLRNAASITHNNVERRVLSKTAERCLDELQTQSSLSTSLTVGQVGNISNIILFGHVRNKPEQNIGPLITALETMIRNLMDSNRIAPKVSGSHDENSIVSRTLAIAISAEDRPMWEPALILSNINVIINNYVPKGVSVVSKKNSNSSWIDYFVPSSFLVGSSKSSKYRSSDNRSGDDHSSCFPKIRRSKSDKIASEDL